MRTPLLAVTLGWLAAGLCQLTHAQTEPPKSVPVATRPLSELASTPLLRAPAEVIAGQRSVLAAETSARVASVQVEVGQQVEAGSVLLTLDRRDAELRVAAASAALKAAQAAAELSAVRLDKARRLIERDFISPDELKEREAIHAGEQATVALRRSDLDLARRELERCTLKAPFDGWVVARTAQLGEWAVPGTPLLTLVAVSSVEVSARLDAALLAAIGPDRVVEFIDGSERRWPLQWLRAAPVLDPATRQAEVRLGFADAAATIGSSGRIEWRGGSMQLPPELIVRREGALGVFLLQDRVARFHPLPEAVAGRPATVALPAESRVITSGREALQDGDPVRLDGVAEQP